MFTKASQFGRLHRRSCGNVGRKSAFTLIELLVVVVILSILASLSLAGLAITRQRAKADKTRSTIRKIDAVIRPMYDSYRTRRVTTTGTTTAQIASSRLVGLRTLMMREMPDAWPDVPSAAPASGTAWYTGALKGYVSYQSNLVTGYATDNGGAECLFMILARSGFDPESLEAFRADEVGDTDSSGPDGAPEFLDGWGNPIIFLRWAPGLQGSLLQVANADTAHDPLDPNRLDYNPSNLAATGYALIPLIASGGPDNTYGLVTMSSSTGAGTVSGWSQLSLASICSLTVSGASTASWNGQKAGVADPSNATAASDNITNHDLSRK